MHSEDIKDFAKEFKFFMRLNSDAIKECEIETECENLLISILEAASKAEEREAETREEDLNTMALELKADQEAGR